MRTPPPEPIGQPERGSEVEALERALRRLPGAFMHVADEFDAVVALLADREARLAEAERERDEARKAVRDEAEQTCIEIDLRKAAEALLADAEGALREIARTTTEDPIRDAAEHRGIARVVLARFAELKGEA